MSLKRIGAGALDYDFGALDDMDNPFTKSYMNLVYDRQLSVSSVVQVPVVLTVCPIRQLRHLREPPSITRFLHVHSGTVPRVAHMVI